MFKLDTGTQVNVLPYECMRRLNSIEKIQKTKIKLEAYGGLPIKHVGQIYLEVETKNTLYSIKFLVVKEHTTSILGLPSCLELELIRRIDSIEGDKRDVQKFKMLDNNRDAFEEMVCFPDLYKIKITRDARLHISTARRIPLKIRDKFKEKLNNLVQEEIRESINEPLEWVNNIVIVQKPIGDLRICIDPRALINLLLEKVAAL